MLAVVVLVHKGVQCTDVQGAVEKGVRQVVHDKQEDEGEEGVGWRDRLQGPVHALRRPREPQHHVEEGEGEEAGAEDARQVLWTQPHTAGVPAARVTGTKAWGATRAPNRLTISSSFSSVLDLYGRRVERWNKHKMSLSRRDMPTMMPTANAT